MNRWCILIPALAVAFPLLSARAQETCQTGNTTINVETDGLQCADVAQVLERNGREDVTNLTRVDVVANGFTHAIVGADCVNNVCGPAEASIQLNINDLETSPDYSVGHEYGHVWASYYQWTYWDGSLNAYLEARGLFGDPRLDPTASGCLNPNEIIANDYQRLFGYPETKAIVAVCPDYSPAEDVPTLYHFLGLNWTQGEPPANYCFDLTGDGFVDISDVSIVTSYFGRQLRGARFDFNWDGVIDISDVSEVTASSGRACPP